MIAKDELKQKLLNTGLFLNNKYLDEYLNLMLKNNTNVGYVEKHHILQRSYFKKNKLPIDNSDSNIANLSYRDHCKAHWLLYFCTVDYLKKANAHSVRYIVEMYKVLTGKDKNKFDFVDEDFQLLQNYMLTIINDEDSRYWTEIEIAYLKENYYGYGAGPKCAEYLNKPVNLINEKARKLGLANECPNWTAAELDILFKYYPIEGTKVYKRISKHSEAACRAKALQLKIRTKNHYWTEEEISILKANFPLVGSAGCSKLLNRNKNECKHKAARLGLVYENNPQKVWTESKLAILLQNKSSKISELMKLLGFRYSTIKKKLIELNLYNEQLHCSRNKRSS